MLRRRLPGRPRTRVGCCTAVASSSRARRRAGRARGPRRGRRARSGSRAWLRRVPARIVPVHRTCVRSWLSSTRWSYGTAPSRWAEPQTILVRRASTSGNEPSRPLCSRPCPVVLPWSVGTWCVIAGNGKLTGTYVGPDPIFDFWRQVARETSGGFRLTLCDARPNDTRGASRTDPGCSVGPVREGFRCRVVPISRGRRPSCLFLCRVRRRSGTARWRR